MTGKVKCTCGWSWNKSDSSKKDMYVCHECGRDNSNNMKDGGWLDNYNDSETSVPEGYEGEGYSMKGRNYSPAWGGQFQLGGSVYPVNYVPQAQEGKELTFLQPTSDKLPEGYIIPYNTPSSERAMSIGGENGEPAYLIPSFKYGKPLDDPMGEFRKTGEHLGGPFKTYQEADEWERTVRHPAVERKETIMFPQEKFAMGGSIPGAVGFSYARTQGAAPSKGPHRNKVDVTDASAQNGKEMQYYQNGLDFKPKSISKNGGWLSKYDKAQTGKQVEYGTPEYREAYNRGEVVTDEGGRSPIQLDEVIVNKKSPAPGFWKQSRDRFLKDNQDASVLGAIGAGVMYPFGIPQEAMMYGLTDKVQMPSEAIGFDAQEKLFASPASFGKHASNFVLDAVTDPANLVGAGLLTKEKALSKLKNIPKGIAPELRQGLQTNGFLDMFKSKPKSEINWGKWNSEISDNPQLIKEYNAIEQTTKANGSWMKNPDGSNFTGTPEQFVQQNSTNFKKAFSNTKVRDPKGNVQITNHSTWDKFDEFDLNKFGQTDDGFYGKGAYFHPNTNSQGLYGDINMNSYVNIENPMPHETRSFFGREGRGSYWDSAKNEQVKIDDLGSLWKGKYDGYITPHGEYPLNDFNSTEYITNIPSNIKSATGNNGMFDMTNPNIYKAVVPGAIGLGALQQKKDGGIIKDDRGQWDHPGEITEIGSNDITMEGVPYDVLGISDTGDTKLMKPGKNYKFKGKKVTEYPMAQNGLRQEQKGLQNLDNLTNFTNYNKPQPGGWLNKYN